MVVKIVFISVISYFSLFAVCVNLIDLCNLSSQIPSRSIYFCEFFPSLLLPGLGKKSRLSHSQTLSHFHFFCVSQTLFSSQIMERCDPNNKARRAIRQMVRKDFCVKFETTPLSIKLQKG